MTANYVLPAATFQQEFRTLAAPVALDLNTCIVGPRKKVVKKGLSAAEETDYGAYVHSAQNTFELQGLPAGEKVEAASVVVELTDVHTKYGTLSGSNIIEAGAAPNEIKFGASTGSGIRFQSGTALSGNTFTRPAALGERDVLVGDRVKVVHEGGTLWSRVTGFTQEFTTPEVIVDGTDANDPANPTTQSITFSKAIVIGNGAGTRVTGDITEDTGGNRYIGDIAKGVIADVYTLECILAGGYGTARFSVTSTSGDNVASVTAAADANTRMAVGSRGLGIKIANLGTRPFEAGEKFTVSVTSAYTPLELTVDNIADYEGLVDTVYQVKVIKGGKWDTSPKVVVTTVNGIDSSSSQVVQVGESFSLGKLGLTATFVDNSEAQDGLLVGDIYNISVSAQKENGARTIKLRDPLPQLSGGSAINATGYDLSVSFYAFQNSVVLPAADYPEDGDENWSVSDSEDSVVLEAGINVIDPTILDSSGDELPSPVEKANVSIYYTAVISSVANRLGTITSPSSILGVLGDNVPENPVAYGVSKAIANSSGQTVYYITTAGDSVEDYTAALRIAERNADLYFMVPMSQSLDVQDLFHNHATFMSGENIGMERVAVVSRTLATETDLYSLALENSAEGYVAVGPELSPAKYRRVTIPGATFVTDGVRTGDVVKLNFSLDVSGNDVFETYLVESVTDEENLLIIGGPSNPVGDAVTHHRIEVARPLTPQEQAELGQAQAEWFGDRRVVNIFPDVFEDVDGNEIGGHFMAAAVAGLKSSVVAHQPITNFQISGFLGASRSLKFNIEELNTLASGGNFIVAQDVTNGPLYIRHQLTTDMTDVNHQEFSITVNVDSITKYLRSYIRPLIGQYNITEEFLIQLETLSHQRLAYLIQETRTVKAGPQILTIGDINAVQDPDIRTKILMEVPLTLPYPGNNIMTRIVIG